MAVIGAGYVGLSTAVCLAHLGHVVVCADVDAEKVELLQGGGLPIFEPGLEALLREGLRNGRLQFVLGAAQAVPDAEFVFLCVPTPQGADGSADLSYIEAAAREISGVLEPGAVVVNKSTVPVGSTKVVERVLGRADVHVVSNPEFLREGSAVHDFLKPDRVVIGSDDRSAALRLGALYSRIPAPVIITSPPSAETIKYAANAFLATKVSFVNALAAVCEAVGADVSDVVQGVGFDRRIGHEFLRPGPGWGGSCLPKDTRALVRIADDHGYAFELLEGVIAVNDEQRERIIAKVEQACGGSLDGVVLAVWGLTFKANTDDLRDSPAVAIVDQLVARGAKIKAHDPAVDAFAGPVDLVDDPYDACDGAQALVVLTEWDEFRWLDFEQVRHRLARPAIVDARNLLDPDSLADLGFTYQGVGR